jgi:ABC-2 type transport system ATP-binding protein
VSSSPESTPYAIEVQNIRKTFPLRDVSSQREGALQEGSIKNRKKAKPIPGVLEALKGVSFQVNPGSVFTILGSNGAGKTTLLRILTTLMRPDSGTAFIHGHDLFKDALQVRHVIGVVSQENHFDGYLSIWNNLMIHAQMHGLSKSAAEHRITELLEKVGLYGRRLEMTDTLSGGMQRRVALVRALIHRPKVLFLDEPTTGLDPQARQELWETIREFKKSATVILTTHYMDEADYLSDEIMMMQTGQVVMQGTPRALKNTLVPHHRYQLCLQTPTAEKYTAYLSEMNFTEIQVKNPYQLEFDLGATGKISSLLLGLEPEDFESVGRLEVDLETVFMSVAGGKHQDDLKKPLTTSVLQEGAL